MERSEGDAGVLTREGPMSWSIECRFCDFRVRAPRQSMSDRLVSALHDHVRVVHRITRGIDWGRWETKR